MKIMIDKGKKKRERWSEVVLRWKRQRERDCHTVMWSLEWRIQLLVRLGLTSCRVHSTHLKRDITASLSQDFQYEAYICYPAGSTIGIGRIAQVRHHYFPQGNAWLGGRPGQSLPGGFSMHCFFVLMKLFFWLWTDTYRVASSRMSTVSFTFYLAYN